MNLNKYPMTTIFVLSAVVYALSCLLPKNSTAKPPKNQFVMHYASYASSVNNSVVWVMTDKDTGCQYIVVQNSIDMAHYVNAVVPRYEHSTTSYQDNKIRGCR